MFVRLSYMSRMGKSSSICDRQCFSTSRRVKETDGGSGEEKLDEQALYVMNFASDLDAVTWEDHHYNIYRYL